MRLLFLHLLLSTKNKFLATDTLISLLMKAGLSLNVLWQGTSKALLRVDRSSFTFKTLWTVLCICLAWPFLVLR